MVNCSLAGVSVWRYLGLNFVLFLGAIQSIPGELYEAAEHRRREPLARSSGTSSCPASGR